MSDTLNINAFQDNNSSVYKFVHGPCLMFYVNLSVSSTTTTEMIVLSDTAAHCYWHCLMYCVLIDRICININ